MSNVNRKLTVSSKDLALAAVLSGRNGVLALFNGKGFTAKTLAGAIETVGADSDHGKMLSDLGDTLFVKGDGTRGRKAAAIGDRRLYAVQEVNESGPFIRLPVALLGLQKGDDARVAFLDGEIIVTHVDA